ncbi:peroxide stress protein YaaA [Lactobacillus sp. PV034]|uniref:peroxide stress protein YaaA n=1 Tax=Lactobacillus sp. PV034 TaxID=2594495 RepID=UPI00223FDA6D|nr:peroxide stress protein YaaA [Lactobacillus sp. PV034]QNQ81240.1 peroxide stress protein YaaA [Lactobacillus sp. PV034]
MKIIIAPAKKMVIDQDSFPIRSMPDFLDKTQILWDFLKSRDYAQLKDIWRANDKIVKENQLRLQNEDLKKQLTPAIFAYSGLQYQYIGAGVLEQEGLDYLQENLRVVSGLYGLLRPFDGIIPYRLEMQNKLVGFRDYSLYHFWNDRLYQAIYQEDEVVINLASKEYSRLFTPYIKENQQFITIEFLEEKHGKWRQSATHAKMARGAMVRFMAQNQVTNIHELQAFNDFGYHFDEESSTSNKYVFKKEVEVN